MMKITGDIKLGVIGGDTRQLVMARELAAAGAEVAVFALESCPGSVGETTRCATADAAVSGASAVILPLPCTSDGIMLNCPCTPHELRLSELFSLFGKGLVCIGGRFDDACRALAAEREVRLIDYYERGELAVANAIPTAEGAVGIAMRELAVTLHGANVAVVGYGRVGRTLARTLSALGASVTVAARKCEDLAWIRSGGAVPLHTGELRQLCRGYDVIFNTVPATLFRRELLCAMDRSTLIIDLASKPGGVDMRAAGELGISVIWALSLPGKVAPVTAGRAIGECVFNILRDEGVIPSS